MKSEKLVTELTKVPGIVGIVLGEAFPNSDTDFCIYYQESVDWGTLNALIENTEKDYDIIWRECVQIETVIDDCLIGRITIDYQPGYPLGFVNTIYAAEIHYGQILWENSDKRLSVMKNKLGVYPPKLREEVIGRFMFEAAYSMETAVKAAARGDIHYTLGCFFRTVSSWNQVLYALNNRYLMKEEGAIKQIKKLQIKPEHFLVRAEQAYTYFASHNPKLGFDEYNRIHNEITQIVAQNH